MLNQYAPMNCEELSPAVSTWIEVDKLIELIQKVRKRYGAKAQVEFDAGPNNISTSVIPSKAVK